MNLTEYFNTVICKEFETGYKNSRYIRNIVSGIKTEMESENITYEEYWEYDYPDFIGEDVMTFLNDCKYELIHSNNIDNTWVMINNDCTIEQFCNIINADAETKHCVKRCWGMQTFTAEDNYNIKIIESAIENYINACIMNEWYDKIEIIYLDIIDYNAKQQGLI